MEPEPLKHAADLELSRRAARGEVAAWHDFIMGYSGLIQMMTRRYYFGRPEDDQLNLYVGVLEYMYREGLARYDGRAALSTWVMTITRSRCLDTLRHEVGRRRPPRWFQDLPPLERQVYELYYMEFVSPPAILAHFKNSPTPLSPEGLEMILDSLDARMDRLSQKRAAYDLRARSVGALCGRVLEVLDALQLEMEGRAESDQPDHELFQARTRRLLSEIGSCVGRLEVTERRVIELHFYEDVSAPGIARRLNLSSPRRVYTIINKALSGLKAMLEPPIASTLGKNPGVTVKGHYRR